MPINIPTFRTSQTQTGTRAIRTEAPLPVSAADVAGGAPGRGLAAIGGGVTRLGESLFQIELMDRRNKDSLAEIALKNDIKTAEINYETKIANDGDTANWPAYRDEAIQSMSGKTYEWGTSSVEQRAGAVISGWSKVFTETSKLGAIRKRNIDNINATEIAYIDGLATGDDSGEQAYRDALETKYSPETVDVLIADAKTKGVIGRFKAEAGIDPEAVIKAIHNELDLRRQNKGKISEDVLSNNQLSDIEGYAQTVISRRNRNNNLKYAETEKALHKQFIAGTLTKEENDRVFNAGESNVATHKAYDTIIKNKDLMDTDAILAGKWLDGNLTKEDIKLAQEDGRLNNSNTVATWLSRLNKGQFNISVYDNALVRIRAVQFDKSKYDEVRAWLIDNAGELGGKWDDVRNRLETAANASGDAVGPHVKRAHSLIDKYAKDNPEINDGTLDSIRRIQELHDAIDARADYTPEKMRNLTQSLLLPYEEEKAKGWFGTAFLDALTNSDYPPLGAPFFRWYQGKRQVRSKKRKVFNATMLIQPVSKEAFKNKVTGLKSLFGDDSKEARQFYDRYIDSYEWESK